MKRLALVALAASTICPGLSSAQTPTGQQSGAPQGATGTRQAGATGRQGAGSAGPTAKGTTGRAVTVPARATSVRVSVRDPKGENLDGVRLILSGTAEGEYATAGAGTAVITNMKDGMYRLRAEHDGFITLEREFPVHGGVLQAVDIVLTPAPPLPPPPAAPKPAPAAAVAAGPPVNVNIPDFLDRNYIGRDPIKESILSCKPTETVRLLQLRDSVAEHVHDKVDEVLYVVAGDGTIRVGDQTMAVKAGSLAVVPQGVAHAIERRGRNPLIVVSTLSGGTCQSNAQVVP